MSKIPFFSNLRIRRECVRPNNQENAFKNLTSGVYEGYVVGLILLTEKHQQNPDKFQVVIKNRRGLIKKTSLFFSLGVRMNDKLNLMLSY